MQQNVKMNVITHPVVVNIVLKLVKYWNLLCSFLTLGPLPVDLIRRMSCEDGTIDMDACIFRVSQKTQLFSDPGFN